MKTVFTLLIAAFCAVPVCAQSIASTGPVNAKAAVLPDEILSLKKTSHDFGKIPQNRPVTYVFEFENTGKEAIKLENVQAACGCTTPEWSKEPVAPGATGTIKVGYNAAAEGPFSKDVVITFNGSQTKKITITGTVYKAPATSAPANPSISLLKPTNQ
jgi:hypothetical protein